jgi:hypothetical protein
VGRIAFPRDTKFHQHVAPSSVPYLSRLAASIRRTQVYIYGNLRVRRTFRSSAAQRNGLPISRRKRIATTCQKANDLAREAVGCMGVLDGSLVARYFGLAMVVNCSQDRYTIPLSNRLVIDPICSSL